MATFGAISSVRNRSDNTLTAIFESIGIITSNPLYTTERILRNHHSRAAIAAATMGAAVIKAPTGPAAPPVD